MGVVCWLRQTVWIQLTVVVVSLLLLARPLQAATGTTPLDRVVQTDPAGPVGYMAVWQTAQQCPHLGYDVCLKKFRKWVHLRGLHPLTRTLLDLQLAHLTRLKGEREQATLLAESAGFIRVWELPLPGGDVLTLNADPITGAVSSNERV